MMLTYTRRAAGHCHGERENSMRSVLCIIVAGFMFTAAPARAQDADKVTKAEAAALAWLALTDAGDYPRSWDQAAGYFQASISKPNWIHAVGNVRQPLGRLISRKVRSAKYTRSLSGGFDSDDKSVGRLI